jgi:demethylmenaquinone methyltransferase / 2-methoxy-6-polyprenyl-1,4-benzoquinol methylase
MKRTKTRNAIEQNKPSDPEKVKEMFDSIAPEYDRLNHILTMGIDRLWRKKLVRMIKPLHNKNILDIATGTGDLAFAMLKEKPAHIQGLDFSGKMVELCNKKIVRKKAEEIFTCIEADVMHMPFNDNTFDVASISFGIRNFGNTSQALTEINRVIKTGGKFVVIDFFRSRLVEKNRLYRFYMKRVLPTIGKIISKHPWAYKYLFSSVEHFLSETEYAQMLQNHGFDNVVTKKLMGGMAFIIVCIKKNT